MSEPNERDDDRLLAGEYALHLLDADARRAFQARLDVDPELGRLVREWDEALAPLAEGFGEVAPPAALKRRIEGVLFAERAAPTRGRAWGWLAGLGAGVAAAVLALVLLVGWPGGERPVYVAELAAEDGTLVAAARYDDGTLALEQAPGTVPPPGRVLELWLLAEGATIPVSLGVLPEAAATTVVVPEELVPRLLGGLLEISSEPPGGSPTGLPTGEVLGVGQITDL